MHFLIKFILVGALTSKPYSFKGRSWELKGYNCVDLHDSLGSNIKVEIRGRNIMRVLPILNEFLNQDWITNKVRFSFDGITNQRLDFPLVGHLKFEKGNWIKYFNKVNFLTLFALIRLEIKFGHFLYMWTLFSPVKINKNVINNSLIGLIHGNHSLETLLSFKKFFNNQGSSSIYNLETSQYNNCFDDSFRLNYSFESDINGFEDFDSILLISTNLCTENPLLNSFLLSRSKAGIPINLIGPRSSYNFELNHLGVTLKSLIFLIEGRHKFCSSFLTKNNPLIILGGSLILRKDFPILLKLLNRLKKINNNIKINFLPLESNTVGLFDIGCLNKNLNHNILNNHNKNIIEFYLSSFNTQLRFENFNFFNWQNFAFKKILIFQGTHGGSFLHNFDYVMPQSYYLESGGLFINLTRTHGHVPGILPNYKLSNKGELILNNLNKLLSLNLKDFYNLKKFKVDDYSFNLDISLYSQENILSSSFINTITNLKFKELHNIFIENNNFNTYISNFYITDFVTQNSILMNKASKELSNLDNFNYLIKN